MLIKRISYFTDQEHIREIPVTSAQIASWEAGMLIQDAMPNISAYDREFIKTGITPEEWDAIFLVDDITIKKAD